VSSLNLPYSRIFEPVSAGVVVVSAQMLATPSDKKKSISGNHIPVGESRQASAYSKKEDTLERVYGSILWLVV
jgi:hypothetical protein